MREPKFSDASCFGKEFNAKSRICHVCLAHVICKRKVQRAILKSARSWGGAPVTPFSSASRDASLPSSILKPEH